MSDKLLHYFLIFGAGLLDLYTGGDTRATIVLALTIEGVQADIFGEMEKIDNLFVRFKWWVSGKDTQGDLLADLLGLLSALAVYMAL